MGRHRGRRCVLSAPGRFALQVVDALEQLGVGEARLLAAGDRIVGPALVVQLDTTTVVPPGWQGDVDAYGNLLLTMG